MSIGYEIVECALQLIGVLLSVISITAMIYGTYQVSRQDADWKDWIIIINGTLFLLFIIFLFIWTYY